MAQRSIVAFRTLNGNFGFCAWLPCLRWALCLLLLIPGCSLFSFFFFFIVGQTPESVINTNPPGARKRGQQASEKETEYASERIGDAKIAFVYLFDTFIVWYTVFIYQ